MESMIALSKWDYGAMLLYLVAVVAMGLYFSKNEDTSEEYLLGGRRMPWYAVGISCLMSLLSTYSLVMVPGEIFNHGLSLWMLHLAAPVFTVLSFLLFIRFYFRLGSFTPFEYLERRYDSRVRVLIATIVLYTRGMWLAMVLFSTAKVFEGGAGWPAWVTITIVGIVGILYTVMGGLKAVIWTDVLQFFVLIAGMGVAVFVLAKNIDGGAIGAVSYAFEHGRGPTRFADPDFYVINPYVRLTFWLMLVGAIMAPLGTAASDQVNIQRLLSTSTYKESLKAQITSASIALPFTLLLWFVGLAVYSYYSQNPDPRVTAGDTAFFVFVSTKLPPPVPGLILAAMLAAVMSSLDSGINSLGTIWLKEFHEKFINKDMTDRQQVNISKIATVVIGVFAMAFAITISLTSEKLGHSVVEAATIFYALSVVVIPAFLFAVLSPRASSAMIWILASLCWGMNFATTTWHIATKYVSAHWQEGEPLGLGGPISIWWIVIPLLVTVVPFLIWRSARRKDGALHLVRLGITLLPLGYGLGATLWYLCSNFIPVDGPKTLSFQWVGFPGTVLFLVGGVIFLHFSKKQPLHKYQGLTLKTSNEPVLTSDDEV